MNFSQILTSGKKKQDAYYRDERGPENDLIAGWRRVRPGGRIKIDGKWWADHALENHVGRMFWVNCFDYAYREICPKILIYHNRADTQSFICGAHPVKRNH